MKKVYVLTFRTHAGITTVVKKAYRRFEVEEYIEELKEKDTYYSESNGYFLTTVAWEVL